MRPWSILCAVALTGCVDWSSLYGGRPVDAAAPPADSPDEAMPLLLDAAPVPEGGPCLDQVSGPLVLWKFEGSGAPSPDEPIRDLACRPPDVPLGWDLERPARNTVMIDHALYLDGGFLFSGIPQSDQVGRAIARTHSLSLELWVRTGKTGDGTIFSTAGGTNPGRAFAVVQKEGALRFAVHSTLTDPDGTRFTAGGSAEAVASLAGFDPTLPLHVVATYADRSATLYVDGLPSATVAHGHTGPPAPPVWASGKNELGLGGTFEGAPWRGWVYLVAIYDRALSPDEVRGLFAQGPRR